MKTFKSFNEEKINYNHMKQHWQIRGDESGHPLKSERERVVLQGAKPHVDHDAHLEGKKLYAYMHGSVVRGQEPNLTHHTSHPVKFIRGDTHTPFVHAHTGEPFHGSDYMVFHKNQITAYHKKK